MLPRIHLLKLECMQKVSVGLATVKVSFSGMHLFPDLETSREIACRRLIGKSTCGALLTLGESRQLSIGAIDRQ